MKNTHAFHVDLTNPGQFLACCGLLELANCLDNEAVGWFADNKFCLEFEDGQTSLAERFIDCKVMNTTDGNSELEADEDNSEDKSPPLFLGDPFHCRLDWWTTAPAIQAGFKTWSGGQTVLGFLDGMRHHMRTHSFTGPDLLTHAIALNKPKPFYFDCRLSVLTTLDMGFSAEQFSATYSPAVEALALVGLQRFRPATVEVREKYAYSTWKEPLPAMIAAGVVHGLIPSLCHQRFQFPFVVRTGGKYKAFGPSRLIRSKHA
jgi:CRISPR-associated protein Csb3